jgi:hypothetical protein
MADRYVDIRVPPPESAFIHGPSVTRIESTQTSSPDAPEAVAADAQWSETPQDFTVWDWEEFDLAGIGDDWIACDDGFESSDRQRQRILHRLQGRFLERTLRRLM